MGGGVVFGMMKHCCFFCMNMEIVPFITEQQPNIIQFTYNFLWYLCSNVYMNNLCVYGFLWLLFFVMKTSENIKELLKYEIYIVVEFYEKSINHYII